MSYVIKTKFFEVTPWAAIPASARARLEGGSISAGDEAFLWFDETKPPGVGLAWRCTIVEVAPEDREYRVVLNPQDRVQRAFGNHELDNFREAEPGSPEHELYRKLRKEARDAIRKVGDGAASILRDQFETPTSSESYERGASEEIER